MQESTMPRSRTRRLVFAALMIACTLVLEQLRIFHMPQGGSVTLGGMVPLLLLAYREGPAVGMLGGGIYGLLNLLQDPFVVHPVQVLFDYPLPYMCMGLAAALPRHRVLSTALAFAATFSPASSSLPLTLRRAWIPSGTPSSSTRPTCCRISSSAASSSSSSP